jgi:hypothetical protein
MIQQPDLPHRTLTQRAPDHAYYLAVKQRLGGKRAALSVARKLAREAYHTLRELGDQALAPAELPTAA